MTSRHIDDGSAAAFATQVAYLVQSLIDLDQDQAKVATSGLSLLCELVPQTDSAALVIAEAHAPARVLAATTQLASLAAQLQHQLGEGPSVEALRGEPLVYAADLSSPDRWPELSAQLPGAGISSVASCGLVGADQRRAEISLFAASPNAFGDAALDRIRVLCGLMNVLVLALEFRDRSSQLVEAVQSNRQIGIATGVLMARRLCTADKAFAALRRASERQHLKLREIAEQVIVSGELDAEADGLDVDLDAGDDAETDVDAQTS